ncbi:hypothetical protein J14TS5_44450 [Paenibacillus lautus]|jgi:hypothetical protein|nr:hypothetical protein J14TS5_44450 [Paenibacillus lautus]
MQNNEKDVKKQAEFSSLFSYGSLLSESVTGSQSDNNRSNDDGIQYDAGILDFISFLHSSPSFPGGMMYD